VSVLLARARSLKLHARRLRPTVGLTDARFCRTAQQPTGTHFGVRGCANGYAGAAAVPQLSAF